MGEARERDREVAAVGLAVAGFVDPQRRSVSFGAHLPWRDEPVADRTAARLGLPVTLEHDANAAGLAEHRVGAAAGARVAVLVALGTGIGAALVIDGELVNAVRAASRGDAVISPELLGRLLTRMRREPARLGRDLTDRESEILGLLARGLLHISSAHYEYIHLAH